MPLQSLDARAEQRSARIAVLSAVLSVPLLVAVYFSGPHWVLLVWLLGSTGGYITERLRLSRSIISRLEGEQGSMPRPGASWSA
jgi:hypothetical protein